MNELKSLSLTLVTENQEENEMAVELGDMIRNELGEGWKIERIAKYPKFLNSRKIEFVKDFGNISFDALNILAIQLTDKLVSPWLLYFDDDENSIELIYNKQENAKNRNPEYLAIKWGHLQMNKRIE